MDLFDKIIPKDNQKQRMRLAQAICGENVIRLSISVIFLYMIPTAITKYVVNIMNLYVVGILSGLTGAFWGYIISRNVNDRDKIMTYEPWFSQEKYRALMTSLSLKTRNYLIVLFVEIIVIIFFKIY